MHMLNTWNNSKIIFRICMLFYWRSYTLPACLATSSIRQMSACISITVSTPRQQSTLAQRRYCRPDVGPTLAQPTLLSGLVSPTQSSIWSWLTLVFCTFHATDMFCKSRVLCNLRKVGKECLVGWAVEQLLVGKWSHSTINTFVFLCDRMLW